MTPPLDSRQNARCGRSSLFPEQGDRSPPYPRSLAGRPARIRRGLSVCGKMPPAMGTVIKRAGLVGTWEILQETRRTWYEVKKRGEHLSGGIRV